MTEPRNDVAIYAPPSAGLYDRTSGRTGGAEQQMALLAQALAGRGLSIAHVVYPVAEPVPLSEQLTLVTRAPNPEDHRVLGRLREARVIWRALDRADASVLVVRTGTPVVGLAALHCRVRRRCLIFSSANNFDFTLERFDDRWYRRTLYRLGVRLAETVVVQSKDQMELSRRLFPRLRHVVEIPSFAENADLQRDRSLPQAFLWVGRLVGYKHPERFVELARALPEAPFRMLAVPDEPAGYALLEELRRAAANLGNLELLDPMSHTRTLELIGQSVAIVNTARFEGMPNVFLEAWSRGVPVLTFEFDPDGVVAREGLGIAATGSWETFLEGAGALWNDRDHRQELEERVRTYVRSVHSVDVVAERWLNLIAQLLR